MCLHASLWSHISRGDPKSCSFVNAWPGATPTSDAPRDRQFIAHSAQAALFAEREAQNERVVDQVRTQLARKGFVTPEDLRHVLMQKIPPHVLRRMNYFK